MSDEAYLLIFDTRGTGALMLAWRCRMSLAGGSRVSGALPLFARVPARPRIRHPMSR